MPSLLPIQNYENRNKNEVTVRKIANRAIYFETDLKAIGGYRDKNTCRVHMKELFTE